MSAPRLRREAGTIPREVQAPDNAAESHARRERHQWMLAITLSGIGVGLVVAAVVGALL